MLIHCNLWCHSLCNFVTLMHSSITFQSNLLLYMKLSKTGHVSVLESEMFQLHRNYNYKRLHLVKELSKMYRFPHTFVSHLSSYAKEHVVSMPGCFTSIDLHISPSVAVLWANINKHVWTEISRDAVILWILINNQKYTRTVPVTDILMKKQTLKTVSITDRCTLQLIL